MHLSAIPLGEMRTCTFCGSRLRAWYLLVGNPKLNLHFHYKPGKGDHPRYIIYKVTVRGKMFHDFAVGNHGGVTL